MESKPNKLTEINENERYCLECGEEDAAYLATYANGGEWKCKSCGNVYLWPEEDSY